MINSDNLYKSTYVDKCHVDTIDIWTLFTINFDGYKRVIQQTADFFVFKAFSFHHMAPVTR